MSRSRCSKPVKIPSEKTLRRLLVSCKAQKEKQSDYIAFARELAMVIRKPAVPDFTRRVKRIVLKFFNRGLSGRLLWKVGCAVIAWRFPPGGAIRPQKGENYGKKC